MAFSTSLTSTLAASVLAFTASILAGWGAAAVAGYTVEGTTVGPGFSRPEGIKLNLVAGA